MPRSHPTPSEIAKAQAEAALAEPAVDESSDLSDLTVPELKERAKEAGVDGYSEMRKAELIEALDASE